ncbi:MAG: hypothetical protein ABWY92_14715 [Xanthobacteraceae bacterium]
MAQQLWYDIVSHENGWAIVITPDRIESFRTKKAAFDAAVEYARKLRFVGYAVQVRMQHRREGAPAAPQKKAS